MLIFETPNGREYIFIHIPKNCGTYLSKEICTKYKVIKNHWGYYDNLDMAHLPYILYQKYNSNIQLKHPKTFIAWVRNPYNRLISAFLHLNKKYLNSPDIHDRFKNFVDNELSTCEFLDFNPRGIHYYPQHRFLTDENNQIPENITIYHIDNYDLLDPKPEPFFEGVVNSGYTLDLFYNKPQILTVNRLYQRDFDLFGYKMYIPK